MSQVFTKYSNYYDIFYKDKDYRKETDFLLEIIKKYGVKGNKILSLGCGTCTYELLLAKAGFNSLGLDFSAKMLDIAKEKISKSKLGKKIQVELQDVRKISVKEKFDIAMCMFNVIGYQNSNLDLEMTLKGVANHLNPGGVFFFDLWHAPAVISDPPQNRVKKVEIDGREIERITESKFYPTKDLIEIKFTVNEKGGNGKLKTTSKETHTMRYFSLPEMEYFLDKAGMKKVGVYNFPEIKSAVSDDKWDIFIVAKKK